MGIGDIIVLVVSLTILGIWPVVIIYSRFRPDPKPQIGAFESFAGLVRGKDEQLWGKLVLRDGTLTFTPHDGSEPTAVAVSELKCVEMLFTLRSRIATRTATENHEFEFFKFPLVAHGGDEANHSRRVRNEWKRQFRALGVRIEPDDSWAPMH
jgi:hypothetical protein